MNCDKNEVRILHTADIHLGASNRGGYNLLEIGEQADRCCAVLKSIVDLSIYVKADLIVIAGDLFDRNLVDSSTLESALRQLNRATVPVLILPGNHDCLSPKSVYVRVPFAQCASNVHIFINPEGERFSLTELDLAVWGKPVTDAESDFRPMSGIPPRGKERWQIAVAHGHYVGAHFQRADMYQISQEEIVESCYDYVALGHWPSFCCVCDAPVKAFYCGAASETGTVAIVDFFQSGEIEVRCHWIAPSPSNTPLPAKAGFPCVDKLATA